MLMMPDISCLIWKAHLSACDCRICSIMLKCSRSFLYSSLKGRPSPSQCPHRLWEGCPACFVFPCIQLHTCRVRLLCNMLHVKDISIRQSVRLHPPCLCFSAYVTRYGLHLSVALAFLAFSLLACPSRLPFVISFRFHKMAITLPFAAASTAAPAVCFIVLRALALPTIGVHTVHNQDCIASFVASPPI